METKSISHKPIKAHRLRCINGTMYKLISSKILPNGRTELKLQRPNGRRFYFAVVYENGAISEVV